MVETTGEIPNPESSGDEEKTEEDPGREGATTSEVAGSASVSSNDRPATGVPEVVAPAEENNDTSGDSETLVVPVEEITAGMEAVLYAAGEPLTLRALKKVFPEVSTDQIKEALTLLVDGYSENGRGLQIAEVAGGYQITTRPEHHERVSRLFDPNLPKRLSIQALETLAAIAYRQPITVPEIMELRGVRSASVVRTLLEKKLIRIMGRKDVVGRPLLYGTTREFMLRFGLKNLGELPRLEDMAEVFGEDLAELLPPGTENESSSSSDSGDTTDAEAKSESDAESESE